MSQFISVLRYIARWTLIAGLAGVLSGTASAFLLVALNWATDVREGHKWMIALLPVAGLAVGLLYKYVGPSVDRGNDLIIDEIHDPHQRIPARMTPLILLGTIVSHLFGGSVGREGTAVQMGGSLADRLARPFRLGARDRRILLMAGVSAGFGSVFGTPLAGAVFGIEVLLVGAVSYEAIAPCFIASFVGDVVTNAWGGSHTRYHVTDMPALTVWGMLWAAVAGMVFGLVGMWFAEAAHWISAMFKRYVKWEPMRPFLGGIVVAVGVWAVGTTRYIGLGEGGIMEAFGPQHRPWDFAGKFVFTVMTLGSGFKGGEVTPLFFIGATLGNALSYVLPLPSSLLAGMGFVAVFSGAANTPIASTLMAMELFGGEMGAYAGIACVASYLFSGRSGIYSSQRMGFEKTGAGSLATEAKREMEEGTPPTPELLPKSSKD